MGSGHETIHSIVKCESCAGMCVGGILFIIEIHYSIMDRSVKQGAEG